MYKLVISSFFAIPIAKIKVYTIGLSLFCFASLLQGQVKINEILAANLTINYDDSYNYESWIELYNNGVSSLNVGGYYLSDEKNNLRKWMIPSGTNILGLSYKIIWCNKRNSGLNANFKIDPRGSVVYLSTYTAQILDSITIPAQYPNISYGRVNNGTKWAYFAQPTPSSTNGGNTVFGRLVPPVFSIPSGRYSSSITVSISSTVSGNVQIHYTIDGSEPTAESTLYTGPFVIKKTTIVKSKVFHSGTIPSQTVTKSYFINEHSFNLPVVSVSMNPAFLNDNTIGIYVEGLNGKTGNCSDLPRNWNQDWERACVAQIFDTNGKEILSQGFDASIAGKCSRTAPQKSISFEARQKFEKGNIDLQLFQSKELQKFDAFNLRNSGNDFWNTMMRDGLMQTLLIGKMGVDYQGFQPAIAYMNGQYWGVMNIREKIDANYIKNNYSVSSDSIDLLEGNGWAIEGSSSSYTNFINKIKTMDVSKNEAFSYIDANIDVDEYIHYLIAQIYYGNTDWPGNNIKFWKHKRPGSKWRWIIFDTDFGFAIYPDKSTATHKTLHFVTDSTSTVTWPNPQWSTLLFRRLIKNPTFKERFVQSFMASFTTVFKPGKVHQCIDSLSGLIAAEMVYHKQKWGGSITDWNNEIQELHNFADQRYSFFIPYFLDFFKVSTSARISASANIPEQGMVYVNEMRMCASDTFELFRGLPFKITAKPADGYRFKKWNIKSKSITREYLVKKGDNWKYNDKGIDLNTAWMASGYDDMSWNPGTAELGYGDGDEKTTVGYGTDPNNRYITTYFRKTITVSDTSKISSLRYNVLFDDGAVIYINETEAARVNMPVGAMAYNTLANSNVTEGVFVQGYINPKLLKPGSNTISVEIHQVSVNSSDISFDMELEVTKNFGETISYSTIKELKDTVDGDMSFVAEFEPVDLVSDLYINEISAKDSHIKDEYNETSDWFELYNAGNDTINLFGLYLTDSLNNPCKYKIMAYNQTGLKLPPHGFQIFWADDDSYKGINHCSFKLFAKGEQLGVFQVVGKDTLFIDTLTYGKQMDGKSYSRFPDGNSSFIFTNALTPKASNKESVSIPASIENTDQHKLKVFPVPADKYIYVETHYQLTNTGFDIFNLQGKKVDSGILRNSNEVDCSKLTDGIYILKLYTKGELVIVRFLVKH